MPAFRVSALTLSFACVEIPRLPGAGWEEERGVRNCRRQLWLHWSSRPLSGHCCSHQQPGLVFHFRSDLHQSRGQSVALKARLSSPHGVRRGRGQDIGLPWLHTRRTKNAAYCPLATFTATGWGRLSTCVLPTAQLEGTLMARLQISKSGSPDVEDLPQ